MLEILLIMGALSGGTNKESTSDIKPKPIESKNQEIVLEKKHKK